MAAAKALTTRRDLAIGIHGAAGPVLEGSGVDPVTIALVSLSTTLATNALVEGQGGRVGLLLIGFDEAAAARARIVDTFRGDACIRIGGGHDAAGRACGTLDLDTLDRAIAAQTRIGPPTSATGSRAAMRDRNFWPVSLRPRMNRNGPAVEAREGLRELRMPPSSGRSLQVARGSTIRASA